MEYTRDVKISEIEWLLIQKFRLLLSNKFGTFIVAKVRNGRVLDIENEIDIRICLNEDRTKLEAMQQ